jgi:vitamin B12 transporter
MVSCLLDWRANRRILPILGLALGCYLAAVSPVAAQPSPAPPPPEPATPTFNLPEAPETIVEGRLDGVGSQGSAVSGGTVLDTPNLTPTPLSQSGSSVSVITEQQIRQRGQTSMVELLRGLPGIDVVRQSTPGSVTTVFIRGTGSEHTKVLIDGIPANDPSNTARFFDFSALSVDNIERIEVLRGPQSVLYGSDAIGGVINIITKKGRGPNTGKVATQGGAFSTGQVAASTSGSVGGPGTASPLGVYYSAGGSYYDTNGFSSASSRLPGNTENDGFQLGTLSTRMGIDLADDLNVDWVVRHNHAHIDFDKGGGPNRDDPNDINRTLQTVMGLRVNARTTEWFEQSVAWYVSDIRRDISSPGEPPINNNSFVGEFNGVTQQIDFRNTLHVLDNEWFGNSITFGGLYQTEVASSSTVFDFGGFPFPSVFPKTSLDDGAVYGESRYRLGESWYTTIGVRSDHFNLYGANDTYRTTSLYRLPGWNTAFRATLGTGFRAPSLFQRLDPFVGNPVLLPEDAKGWDCGIEQPLFGGLLVPSVTYFRNDFQNFIFFDQNANFGNGQYLNIPTVRTSGVEFNTLYVLTDRSTLTTSYTYTDARDLSTGSVDFNRQLIRRPRNKFGIVYNTRFWDDRGNWNVGLNYVGDRFDQVGFPSTRVNLADYVVVNTAASFDVTRHLQIFGRVDNLFNEKYEEVAGFGVARISAYTGAAVTW